MKLGDIIRKYRLQTGMTQEEMANRLGVTAPAVNKWEKNHTLPDVALLAPIARLLGITTDTLLSFREELTAEELNQFLTQLQRDLEERSYDEAFLCAKAKIQEYPNCGSLIWQAACILDAWRKGKPLSGDANYEDTILDWYDRCLHAADEQIRSQAADSLFHFYFQKGAYEKALSYTAFFSRENPERKRKEALGLQQNWEKRGGISGI